MVKQEKVIFAVYANDMRNFYFAIVAVLTILSAANAKAEEDATSDFNCNITDEQTVHWTAMSQAVTLRTQVKHQGEVYPSGFITLILEDGTEVDLGQGGKYMDDGPDDEFSDCKKHLQIAKADTLDSLSGKARFSTLESLWAYSAMGQDCMDGANLTKDGPSENCQQAASVHQDFMEASIDSSMDFAQFKRLRDSRAPLITVRRSTYYSETYVYDAQTNTLHNVLTEGC